MAHTLYTLLTYLDDEALLYHLERAPPDGVLIGLSFSGERLEIAVSEDGKIEFFRFTGDDNVGDGSTVVANLYRRLRSQIGH